MFAGTFVEGFYRENSVRPLFGLRTEALLMMVSVSVFMAVPRLAVMIVTV